MLRRGWRRVIDSLPRIGEEVLYRTETYQAMGIYEGENVWRCSNGEREAVLIVWWQPLS
jgi:hypothetical protein